MPAPSGSVRAVIVTVGDELLLGHTVDTNAAWLGGELGALGVRVVRRYTVSDEEPEIRWAVRDAMGAADLVLVSGGLGPTPDDVTRDAVAGLLHRPLRTDPDVLESIRARFLEAGMQELPEPNRRVAQVPEGARKLPNPVGTAPGLALETGGALVVLLPGVPRELRSIIEGSLGSLLSRHFPGRLPPTLSRTLHTSGIPESLLAQRVRERLPEGTGDVRMAFLPDIRGVDLRLTVTGMDPVEAGRHFEELERKLGPILDPWRFHGDRGDLADAVVVALRARDTDLAVAESCTGGLVAKRLTDIPGASDVFLGGVVAYSNEAKIRHLGVDAGTLERHGAVSADVAQAMAEGVVRAFDAGAGLGVTGIAGPGGGTAEKPVGTVWYAAWYGGRCAVRGERFPGDREAVRERSAQAALMLLLRLLEGRATDASASRG
jgi:nicotinamide-nucleotide amidase